MMRKLLSILFLLLPVVVSALSVSSIGTAALYTTQSDTVFIFADEIGLRSNIGAVDWYRAEDNSVAFSGTEEIYPDAGGYYIIVDGQKEYFYVVSYKSCAPSKLAIDTIIANCRDSRLILSGVIPDIVYYHTSFVTKKIARTCSIVFTTLSWDNASSAWADSTAVMDNVSFSLGEHVILPLYKSTDVVLRYNNEEWIATLGLTPDSVVYDFTHPIAVKFNPTTITTIRGKDGERSNEVQRPTSSDVLTGSAPLDILFQMNPTPAADYYLWKIYRGSTLVVSRTDQDQRYTFNEPGSYRIVATAYNSFCPCSDSSDPDCQQDSTEINVAISESQLLVPNVFTPNGDGQNDEFRVLYRSLREFHCWVYNRWGKLVFEWTDPAKGWDGNIGGRPAAEGAYFYVIRAIGTDAAANAGYVSKIRYDNAKKSSDQTMLGVYQLSGDINLLRGKK